MAQKKRNPYERAQRQFVQKRAEEKGFDEMTPDQREQLRNRFQQLAQTKRGRTTIAQKVLADATPEQRKEFKQRIAQNLPSRGTGELTSTAKPSETLMSRVGANYNRVPTGTSSEAANRMRSGRAGRTSGTTSRATTQATTRSTAKAADTGRYGKGFFSVPKSLSGVGKELLSGLRGATIGALESQSATFVNPAANLAIRGVEKAAGYRKGGLGRFREARAGEAYTNVALAALGTPQAGAVARAGLRGVLGVTARGASRVGASQTAAGLSAIRANSAAIEGARQSLKAAAKSGATKTVTSTVRKPKDVVRGELMPGRREPIALGPATPTAAPSKPLTLKQQKRMNIARKKAYDTAVATGKIPKEPKAAKTTTVKNAPVAKKAPKTKAPATSKPVKKTGLTEQQKVEVVRSKEFSAAIEKASGGQLKPVKETPVKAPKSKSVKKTAPTKAKPPKKAAAQPAVEPAKKPKGPARVEAELSRTEVSVSRNIEEGEVTGRVRVPQNFLRQPVSSKSLSPQAQKKFFENELKQLQDAKRTQVKAYESKASPSMRETVEKARGAQAKYMEEVGAKVSYEFFAGKNPQLTKVQFRQAQRRAGGSRASVEDVQRSIAEVIGEGKVTPDEMGMQRLETAVNKSIKEAAKKKKKAQARKTQRAVKKLREEKGVWKGI